MFMSAFVGVSVQRALEKLRWFQPFTKTQHGSLKDGDVSWFLNGKLNVRGPRPLLLLKQLQQLQQ